MKKINGVIVLLLLGAGYSYGQQYSQIRLRLGIGKSIVSAGKSQENTIYKLSDYKSPLPSGIGLEFFKPLKWKHTSMFIGAFMEIDPYCVTIKAEKFTNVPYGGGGCSGNGSIRVYTGLEKKISNKEIRINKNYFTIFGGFGFSFNFPDNKPDSWWGTSISDGVTKDGKNFKGIFYDGMGNPVFANYFTYIHSGTANLFSPDIFGGLRWNIRNKKGNTVLLLELVGNYGLMPKHSIDVSYTLDGQYQTDRLKDRGANIQLNVLIPLKNFGKNRGRR